MKRIIAVASLAAVGAVSATSVAAQSKPWNVSASLRGFYDDNYATAPSSSQAKRSSMGFELSPSAGYNLQLDPTVLRFDYTYGMKYYEDRRRNSADHSHEATAKLDHAFSEACKISLSDRFSIFQEPGIESGPLASVIRTDGNNIANVAEVSVSGELSRQFGLEFKYSNTLYDYQQDAATAAAGTDSRSALLDRVEHLAVANLRYHHTPEMDFVGGYQFGYTDQTSKDPIVSAAGASPSTRDARSHYGFVGLDHKVSPELNYSLRGGVEHRMYPFLPKGTKSSFTSPYFDMSGTYTYTKDSSVNLGLRHQRGQTDVGAALDSESTVVYGTLSHQITPELRADLQGQYQLSTFNQGGAGINNKEDNIFLVSLKGSYKITDNWSAEAGYSYDRLDADLANRSYYRDRVFIGVRASY